MSRVRKSLLAGFAGLCACGLLQEVRPPEAESGGAVQVQADQIGYDGETLRFRALLGAVDAGIVIDRRLVRNVHVTLEHVRDCATREDADFLEMDWAAPPPTGADLLLLKPGNWFGSNLEYWLFVPGDAGLGPSCIDADFVVLPEPWRSPRWLIPLTIHAERPLPDAGARNQVAGGEPGSGAEVGKTSPRPGKPKP